MMIYFRHNVKGEAASTHSTIKRVIHARLDPIVIYTKRCKHNQSLEYKLRSYLMKKLQWKEIYPVIQTIRKIIKECGYEKR